MQQVEAKQIPTEQAIFLKGWAMVKAYYNISPAASDKEWQAIIDDAKALYEVGTDTATKKLSEAIALGVLDYLEALSKERG